MGNNMNTYIDGIVNAELRDGVVRLHVFIRQAMPGDKNENDKADLAENSQSVGSIITSVKGAMQMLTTLEQLKESLLQADVIRIGVQAEAVHSLDTH
jgi:hypothetical protein